ncbi:MAG: hypothetical protein SV760_07420 [Halobacteria archaeon]|nr:hypothetical protein [Halobacteria archaeon]
MELIAVATLEEVRGFLEGFEREEDVLPQRPLFLHPEDETGVVVTGVGRTNAAATLSTALETVSEVERVVSVGVGGSLPSSNLHVGEVLVGERAVHADLGIVERESEEDEWVGFDGVEGLGFETSPGFHNTYPLTDIDAAGKRGSIATVSTVSATRESAREVERRCESLGTEADVEAMETASVAQVCRLHGVDVSAIMGVSNYAGDEREFDFDAGREAVEEALHEVY